MKYKLVLHPAAARELEEAYRWIAVESKPKADQWYNNLIKKLDMLTHIPNRCPPAPERRFSDEPFRQLIYGKYRIIFLVDERCVRILHIRHGSMRTLGDPDITEIG
ncbi:MAG: type II toxin-antitoxin system RelE/ParE family toxin [Phycisphaerae bacterium]